MYSSLPTSLHSCTLFLLLVALATSAGVQSLDVKNTEYEMWTGNFFGDDYKVALLTTEFTSDIFVLDNLVCPRMTVDQKEIERIEQACPPCNYADPDCCGCAPIKGCECDANEVELYCKSDKPKEWLEEAGIEPEAFSNYNNDVRKNFDEQDNWTPLKEGVMLFNQTADTAKSLYYR
eukprot:TRINITY_DN14836_c0_g1_i1.p1 TRINITY_DN14836_c0_g1~~TRINITY_DN14836_c0_g1_i1.p1  ORF type:complete len:177 (+),score=25.11 TRINITY_DN14836_c0_g1_i1:111-641(+)